VSALLAQPGGFEGFFAGGVLATGDHRPVPEFVDDCEVFGRNLNPGSLLASAVPQLRYLKADGGRRSFRASSGTQQRSSDRPSLEAGG
jgi:hypothetical protein